MNLEIKALKQTSVVSEKELYYVVIGEGENKVVINVGQKTYEGVQKLLLEPKAVIDKTKGGK